MHKLEPWTHCIREAYIANSEMERKVSTTSVNK